MKTSAVYLLLLVFCVASRKSDARGIFGGLFDYISEAFHDYSEYDTSEEYVVDYSPPLTINEAALHYLIQKFCNQTLATPTTTTKSTVTTPTTPPSTVGATTTTTTTSTEAAGSVSTSSTSAATTVETTETGTTNPPPTTVDTNTNAPDSASPTDDGETPPDTQ